jgi:hypothetical protein
VIVVLFAKVVCDCIWSVTTSLSQAGVINFVVLVQAFASAVVALYLVSLILVFAPVPLFLIKKSFSIFPVVSSVSQGISTVGLVHIRFHPDIASVCPLVPNSSSLSSQALLV